MYCFGLVRTYNYYKIDSKVKEKRPTRLKTHRPSLLHTFLNVTPIIVRSYVRPRVKKPVACVANSQQDPDPDKIGIN
jgi:hypothetical protein